MGYTPKFLGHVNIFVRNAERSQKWYEEILGALGVSHENVHVT